MDCIKNVSLKNKSLRILRSLLFWYNGDMKLKAFFNLFKISFPKVNQVILILVFAELIFVTAAGLILPLFSIFIVEDIQGGVETVVGFAVAIYWIVKSILQLPISRYLDKTTGEIDDYYSMLFGFFVVTIAVFSYYFVVKVWQIYTLQFLIAIGDSFVVPPFFAIFTRHIDRENEGFEWTLWSSFAIGIGSALGGALSGILAGAIGIRAIFLVKGTLMVLGLLFLFFLKPYIKPRTSSVGGMVMIEQKRL